MSELTKVIEDVRELKIRLMKTHRISQETIDLEDELIALEIVRDTLLKREIRRFK
ncbi:MAG: hypothetical protein LBT10_06845 [Methanobrevibacter sp.]|jgi:hypothetical protein|nr:hypothetical protein [Methanobrevibacter sp.]